jgi:hypothetical protein
MTEAGAGAYQLRYRARFEVGCDDPVEDVVVDARVDVVGPFGVERLDAPRPVGARE